MFFGREDVIAKLAALMGKSTSSLVTCRGRRRIGKSTLVEEFARKYGARFVKIEGLRPSPRTTNQDEIDNFLDQLDLYGGKRTGRIESWLEAFRELDKLIGEDFTVVLLDEISWMGYFDKLFSDRLKIAWDNMWKKHPKLILVLCGSVSSWIKDNMRSMGLKSKDMKRYIEYGWLFAIPGIAESPEFKLNFRDGVERAASLTQPRGLLHRAASAERHGSCHLVGIGCHKIHRAVASQAHAQDIAAVGSR